MSQSSYNGYVVVAPVTAFDAGQPMSSYRAFENRQNQLHLTDEFSQHRINWTSPDTTGCGIESNGTPSEYPTWSCTYPHTWLAPGKPANLVLRVTGHDCLVRARLVPYNSNVCLAGLLNGNTGPDYVFDETLDVSSGSVTSDSYLEISSARAIAVYESAWMKPSGGGQQGSDGVSRKPAVCLMRLELQLLAELPARVIGVMLREIA